MPKLTKKKVDAAKPKANEYFVWDNDLPGFGLRVFPSGKKSYLVQYRTHRRTRRYTIGLHGPFTPDKARDEAMALLAKIAKGGDPAAEKAEIQKDISIADLCDLYLEEGCGTKKESTIATDKGRIERHIKPLLGKKRVRAIAKSDVEKFLKDVADGKTKADTKTKKRGRAIVRGGKGTASRAVGLLGGIISFAVDKKLRPDNPVHGVKKFPTKRIDKFLSSFELGKLGKVLKRAEGESINSSAIAAIRLLIFTGCRKSEILTLEWEHVDWENRCLRLADSKTGQKIVHLGAPALELLSSLTKVKGNSYVLPGGQKGTHFVGLQKVWAKIRVWEGLDGVRIHDLRHGFASTGVLGGGGLFMVGKLLGHKDSKTTQIYAHLADDAAKQAADRIASQIEAAMNSENEDRKIVPILKGKK
jgi:integrase